MIPTSIKVSAGKRVRFVPVCQIIRLEGEDCYTWLHTVDGSSYLLSRGLGHTAARLPGFWRVHRSHVVNPAFVTGCTITGRLCLQKGLILPVSKRRIKAVDHLLKSRTSG